MGMGRLRNITWAASFLASGASGAETATEFCLEGEFDLGARYQGRVPEAGEAYPTTWCLLTEPNSGRVLYSARGRSNSDMDGEWAVAFLPPDTVRIVRGGGQRDILFTGTADQDEATAVRRIDPQRLFEEWRADPKALKDLEITIDDARVQQVHTSADLPLRGRVPVRWTWNWDDPEHPVAHLYVEDDLLFRARGRWRSVPASAADRRFAGSADAEPIEVPGSNWPARINMELVNITDDVYVVTGVRNGFRHMVVDSEKGLIVADAPAGWVEFHYLPPRDLVPGDGVSGLSQKFIDFLGRELPGRPIHAVVLTHFHDDHAGGIRAFAASGAAIYVPAGSEVFLRKALLRSSLAEDQLSVSADAVRIVPVNESVEITQDRNAVRAMAMGANPHTDRMLGMWVKGRDYFFVSDIHVPSSDDDAPRLDRAATECWFARWAVSSLPAEARVLNSHSEPVTPVARLAKYLESEGCAKG